MVVQLNKIQICFLGFGLLLSIPAINKPAGDEFKNLQVLPKDISSRDLQRIMVDEFQDGLGVGCGYCHKKQEHSILLDYESDEKPEKEIARIMMRMTMELNSKYFAVKDPVIGSLSLPITCATCHKGSPHPLE